MSFVDNMDTHHLSLLQALDGRTIRYVPQHKPSYLITGMFQSFTELAEGESIDLVTTSPVLSVRSSDVPDISANDKMVIDQKEYKVSIVKPDSEGITELLLEAL